MSDVELVMEVSSCLSEVSLDFSVQVKSCLNDWDNLFLNGSLELGEMLSEESVIDSEERGLFWEWNGKSPEMPLESWVNLEGTCSWVHTGSVLSVFNILQGQLVSVIPMFIVFVLSDK